LRIRPTAKISKSAISVSILLGVTAAVYTRPPVFLKDQALNGVDYFELHARRIAFAQDALFGPGHFLPAWYSRELLGAPFSANIQSFPWIPTRLLLLLIPDARLHYAVGVLLAALLAALFTWLYCRRSGLSNVASVAAGWTFASAGYFASRVFAGHLPVLEAYPSLPLLLWLADRATASDRAAYWWRDLIALAVAAACFAVAGHPQIPAYSLAAATLFLVFRPRARDRMRAIAALALGVGATLAAWWPMLLLIRRSTRILSLGPPSNDITLPWHRLLALLQPGIDGWPGSLDLAGKPEFSGYPNYAWFWDTTSYVGLVPIAVIVWLLARVIARKRLPAWPWGFLAGLGTAALCLALPMGDFVHHIIPVAVLRSPARLLYLSTFPAAVALGAGVDAFLGAAFLTLNARRVVVAACLAFHVIDLGGFARIFVQTAPWPAMAGPPAFADKISRDVHGARVAADVFDAWCQKYFDDAGGFDSLILARTYTALLRLAGANPSLNEEKLDAARFPVPALQATGVGFVVTDEPRSDLEKVASDDEAYLYRVSAPAPRASFSGNAAEVTWTRPSSDEIQVVSNANQAGLVNVLESWDPGWSATVDGAPAQPSLANGFTMAVRVPAGRHTIRLSYHTPGRTIGWILSVIDVALLGALMMRRRPAIKEDRG
jgi:hypothetical protein